MYTFFSAATLASCLFLSATVNAFAPNINSRTNTDCSNIVAKPQGHSVLYLLPDQADELEKAAAELMEEAKKTEKEKEDIPREPVDDTTVDSTHSSPAISSMSRSSVRGTRKWSSAFSDLIKGN